MHPRTRAITDTLWPRPTDDAADPLRWSRGWKIAAFLTVAFTNFTSNVSGAGPASLVPYFIAEFNKTSGQITRDLLAWNFLLLGIGNFIWVPIAVKCGKRTVFIASLLLLMGALIWCGKAASWSSLVAARCLAGFAAAAGESIVPAVVVDIFFVHERGTFMGIYVILTSAGSAVGPLVAGYIGEASKETWRAFQWFAAALAGLNLVVVFLAFPETSYRRPEGDYESDIRLEQVDQLVHDLQEDSKAVKPEIMHMEYNGVDQEQGIEARPADVSASRTHYTIITPSWSEIWTSLPLLDRDVVFWRVMLRPVVFTASPIVVWGIYLYGIHLGTQIVVIFNLPYLLSPPPYLFSSGSIGLMQLAALLGFVLAVPIGGVLSDVLTARVVRRAGLAMHPEQRLLSLLPGFWVPLVGCVITGIAAQRKLSWIAVAAGFSLLSFGTVCAPNIAITYVVSCSPANASECLVWINVCKNIVAFALLLESSAWIEARGWLEVFMVLLGLIGLSLVGAIVLYLKGAACRTWFATRIAAKAML